MLVKITEWKAKINIRAPGFGKIFDGKQWPDALNIGTVKER